MHLWIYDVLVHNNSYLCSMRPQHKWRVIALFTLRPQYWNQIGLQPINYHYVTKTFSFIRCEQIAQIQRYKYNISNLPIEFRMYIKFMTVEKLNNHDWYMINHKVLTISKHIYLQHKYDSKEHYCSHKKMLLGCNQKHC